MDDVPKLMGFLQDRLSAGQGREVLKRVEESRYRPSRKLMDHVGQVINGDSRYVLLDEQVVAYDKVRALAKLGFHDRRKTVIIIRGGPGTGKSVIAIKLMADLLLSGFNAHYATGSKAFTETLRSIIGHRGSVQFKYFNSYSGAQPDEIDVLIADESHRIRKTSNDRFTPAARRTNLEQIDELLRAANVCVFLIDDIQVVRPNEIGSVEYIRSRAQARAASSTNTSWKRSSDAAGRMRS
jgi:DNA replication protein DnaC